MKHCHLLLEQGNYSIFQRRRNLLRLLFVIPILNYNLFLAYCVDRYIASQVQTQDGLFQSKDKDQELHRYDERLASVVERMFERCIAEKEYKQVFYFSRQR
jgi:hypothetical protein